MKKKIFIILLANYLFSSPISESTISKVALSLVEERSNLISLSINSIESYTFNEEKIFYIVHYIPKGFALIAADDNVMPIIGYSFNNNYITEDIPLQLDSLLSNYTKNYLNMINPNLPIQPGIIENWEYYLSDDILENENFRDVDPLITANWNQGGNWNNMCPGNTLVGCVAVAMGQVMHYWNHPTQGSGYHYYWHPDFDLIEADFGNTLYGFEGMLNNSATPESQLLLFHSGVAVEMDYGYDGSGAFVCYTGLNAKTALQDHFNYDSNITCVSRNNYSDSEWSNIIIDQLDRGWPIIYRAYYSGGGAGHAWNVDGYSGDLLHCNWGWGGSSNGYFSINSMNGFTEDQGAIINILPGGLEIPVALFEYEVNNLEVSFNDLSEIINMQELDTWFWDFGDGNFSDNSSPIHTYSDEGVYEVVLIVTDTYGLVSDPYYEEILISTLLGDINFDNQIDILDIVSLVNFIIGVDNPTSLEFTASDYNVDGLLNVLDIVQIIDIILE